MASQAASLPSPALLLEILFITYCISLRKPYDY